MDSSYTNINSDGWTDTMKKILTALGYFLLINIVFIVDRVTKDLALAFEGTTTALLPGISFVYVKNRGITWGMFYAHSSWAFLAMTAIIALVIGILGVYADRRWRQNQSIIGEILVLTGAISNLIDRIVHGGIIDFIECSYRGWYFPTFNIADVAIVIGVGIMLIEFWYET